MEVEIIIPAHNCASACLRMLLNLMEQTSETNAEAPEIGVCVVDDASTDETAETIERFVDAVRRSGITGWRFVRRKKRGNAGGARNVGVEGSTAARVAFFDADDDIAEGALRRLLRAFAEAPDADCHIWGFTRLTKDGTTTWLPDFADPQTGYATAPVGPWIKAVRREKFVPFPEGVYCEDCAWWFAQADRVESVATIAEPLYIYDRRSRCFSTSLEQFQNHPRTLEDLAYNNVLVASGDNDRAPSDCLRNLAALYDLRLSLRKDCVRKAWANRFHNDYMGVLSGRWTF